MRDFLSFRRAGVPVRPAQRWVIAAVALALAGIFVRRAIQGRRGSRPAGALAPPRPRETRPTWREQPAPLRSDEPARPDLTPIPLPPATVPPETEIEPPAPVSLPQTAPPPAEPASPTSASLALARSRRALPLLALDALSVPAEDLPPRFAWWTPLTRRWAVVALVLILLAVVARPAVRVGRAWQARRLAGDALAAVERGDWREATRLARDASVLAPAEPLVSLANARLLSAAPAPHPDAVKAWRRVCEIYPSDGAHRLGLALALSRAGQAAEARQEFQSVAPAIQNGADGQMTEAALKLAENDLPGAERAFRAVLSLRPTHEAARLNLATLILRSGPPRVTEGVAMLEELRSAPSPLARTASFALLRHYLAGGDAPRARVLAEALAAPPEGKPEDRLRLVTLLVAPADQFRREELLLDLRREAADDPSIAAQLIAMFLSTGRSDEAAEWAAALPAERASSPRLAPTIADLWERRGQRERLRAMVRSADWGEDPAGRHAFAARLAALDGLPAVRRSSWAQAEKAAGSNHASLERLFALAARWQWREEQRTTLRRLVEAAPDDARRARELWVLAGEQRDTEGVWLATGRLLDSGDESVPVRNDFAGAALLLGRDLARAHRLAWENFQAAPGDPPVAATAATSLRMQGRVEEAREILGRFAEPLPPALALERAACLAATGASDSAREAAARLSNDGWFPEEKRLVESLRQEGKIFRTTR